MGELIPRISVPDIEDSLLVSNALIAFTKDISERTISVEAFVKVMRRMSDLLECLSEEANQGIAFRSFGVTPETLENVDELAREMREKFDGTGE